MMSCLQITCYAKFRNISSSRSTDPQLCNTPIRTMMPTTLTSNILRYQRANTVCLFGGDQKSGSGDESSPWKSLEKTVQGFRKERSVQDILREQMQKKEYSDEFGGGVGRPPGGSGGGGGGGGAPSGGGSEDEGMGGVLDETVQVVLATVGFIFLYIYILEGEEIARLVKDYIKYLFTKKESIRLRRAMDDLEEFYQNITRKEEEDKDWLEQDILNTPTWWHNPPKVKRELGYRLGYYK